MLLFYFFFTEDVLHTLTGAMSLLRRCRVNAALTIQLFSQLFHFINMWLFNKLVTDTDSGLCCHYWGAILRQQLSHIEAWAEKQGLELAADCHLSRIVQVSVRTFVLCPVFYWIVFITAAGSYCLLLITSPVRCFNCQVGRKHRCLMFKKKKKKTTTFCWGGLNEENTDDILLIHLTKLFTIHTNAMLLKPKIILECMYYIFEYSWLHCPLYKAVVPIWIHSHLQCNINKPDSSCHQILIIVLLNMMRCTQTQHSLAGFFTAVKRLS